MFGTAVYHYGVSYVPDCSYCKRLLTNSYYVSTSKTHGVGRRFLGSSSHTSPRSIARFSSSIDLIVASNDTLFNALFFNVRPLSLRGGFATAIGLARASARNT
jgi:hypothetical protein